MTLEEYADALRAEMRVYITRLGELALGEGLQGMDGPTPTLGDLVEVAHCLRGIEAPHGELVELLRRVWERNRKHCERCGMAIAGQAVAVKVLNGHWQDVCETCAERIRTAVATSCGREAFY